MKKIINYAIVLSAVLLANLLITSCTLPPKAVGDQAQSKKINMDLVCARQIDVFQININGAKPPFSAYKHAMKKLRKYTTDKVYEHKEINLTIPKSDIYRFIHSFKERADGTYLPPKQAKIVTEQFKDFYRRDTTIVMIYAPGNDATNNFRGTIFYKRTTQPINVMAFNQAEINKSPVISDTQAWKIVLTHILGHTLGIPYSPSHNKGGYCTRRECNMYKNPDILAVLSVPLNGMPFDYCKFCQAELDAAKKSCPVNKTKVAQ